MRYYGATSRGLSKMKYYHVLSARHAHATGEAISLLHDSQFRFIE